MLRGVPIELQHNHLCRRAGLWLGLSALKAVGYFSTHHGAICVLKPDKQAARRMRILESMCGCSGPLVWTAAAMFATRASCCKRRLQVESDAQQD